MLRICGITYDHTHNYGSCLQAYALKTAIENYRVAGIESCHYELIPISQFSDYRFAGQKADLRGFVKRRLLYPLWENNFKAFENAHLVFADCKEKSELDALNQREDAFVCGSDVIWNPNYNNQCSAYYLDFAKKYKFTYAPSFGRTEIEQNYKEKIQS